MANRKPQRGDRCRLSGKITHVWPNGTISVHLNYYDYPITVPAKAVEDITPKPKGGRGELDDVVLPQDREQ